ncbi:MAG: ABC transporter permease [Planctomycetota bacterium]
MPLGPTRLAIYSLWRREVVRFLRDRTRVMSSLGQPIIFWVLLGAALRNASVTVGDTDMSATTYGEFFFAGTLTMIILFTSIFATITVIEDRMQGFLQGVLVSPVPRSAIALGKIGGGATLALGQALVFMCLAPLAGVPLTLNSFVLAFAVLVMLSLALTGLGFSIAWLMDSTAGYHGIMMVLLLPMWLLSGSMFPVQGAHAILRVVMQLNPMTYALAALRQALYGVESTQVQGLPSPVLAWGVTAGFMLAMFALGAFVVRRRTVRDAT